MGNEQLRQDIAKALQAWPLVVSAELLNRCYVALGKQASAPAGYVMVPVDLVKRAELHLSDWLELDQCECEGPHYCGRTQVSATNRQLRAIAAATSAPAAPEVKP